jgi:hypothetical protein
MSALRKYIVKINPLRKYVSRIYTSYKELSPRRPNTE